MNIIAFLYFNGIGYSFFHWKLFGFKVRTEGKSNIKTADSFHWKLIINRDYCVKFIITAARNHLHIWFSGLQLHVQIGDKTRRWPWFKKTINPSRVSVSSYELKRRSWQVQLLDCDPLTVTCCQLLRSHDRMRNRTQQSEKRTLSSWKPDWGWREGSAFRHHASPSHPHIRPSRVSTNYSLYVMWAFSACQSGDNSNTMWKVLRWKWYLWP